MLRSLLIVGSMQCRLHVAQCAASASQPKPGCTWSPRRLRPSTMKMLVLFSFTAVGPATKQAPFLRHLAWFGTLSLHSRLMPTSDWPRPGIVSLLQSFMQRTSCRLSWMNMDVVRGVAGHPRKGSTGSLGLVAARSGSPTWRGACPYSWHGCNVSRGNAPPAVGSASASDVRSRLGIVASLAKIVCRQRKHDRHSFARDVGSLHSGAKAVAR
mmetsp:Transcript_54162/g.107836  ORF Transcript_54162/g.107836 Transcript_54162/m.107836 type:complete len:212 (+) Transcript_54162:806-1441(+)